jgi:hypothetical protein
MHGPGDGRWERGEGEEVDIFPAMRRKTQQVDENKLW